MKKILVCLSFALLSLNGYAMEDQEQSRKRKRAENQEVVQNLDTKDAEKKSGLKKIRLTEDQAFPLESLPVELQVHILSFVAADESPMKALKNLSNIRLVCQRFNTIAETFSSNISIAPELVRDFSLSAYIDYLFIHANECGNCAGVEAILKTGIDPDIRAKRKGREVSHPIMFNNTQLMQATLRGNAPLVALLLKYKASVAQVNRCGFRALDLAKSSHKEVIELLIEHGALQCSNGQETAFLTATILQDTVRVQELIAQVNINMADEWGATPLMYACGNGDYTLAKLFLDHGADVNSCNQKGLTALFYAARAGKKELVNLLLDRNADIESDNQKNDFQTPLIIAAAYENQEVVELLVAKGADINASSIRTDSALFWAVKYGYNSLVRFLLKNKAKIEREFDPRKTLLMMAARRGYTKIVKLLLAHGAQINEKNHKSETALIKASDAGYTDMIELLVEKGADIGVQRRGKSPLHDAARSGCDDAIRALVGKGANVNVKDESGVTPLILAIYGRHESTVKLLIENGAYINERFIREVKGSRIGETGLDVSGLTMLHMSFIFPEIATLLIKMGADVNLADLFGVTPLMACCSAERRELCKLLLAHGARVNEIDTNGNTALMFCSSVRVVDKKVFKLLLKSGADLNAVNYDNQTALMKAAQNGQLKGVRLLIKNGAHTEIVDINGETARSKAAQNGHDDVVKFLELKAQE